MTQLLLLAAVVAAVVVYSSPALQAKLRANLPRLLLYGGGAVLVILVLTGRLHWLLGAAGGAVLFIQRALSLLQLARAAKPKGAGGPWLTPEMRDGRVSDARINGGRYAGQRLSELDFESLLTLHAEMRSAAPASVPVLEQYLDAVHGERWRNRSHPQGGSLGLAEAYAILGLEEGADRDAIVAAHRRLIQRLHPDRGGSDYLAARINEAKRLLLGETADSR